MSGISHLRFCSSVPYFTSSVWFPEFGATTPNSDGGADGVREDLVHVGELEEVEAGAAVLDRQVRRPQPGLLDLHLDVARAAPWPPRGHSSVTLGLVRDAQSRFSFGRISLVHDLGGEAADLVDPLRHGRDRLHVHRHQGAALSP